MFDQIKQINKLRKQSKDIEEQLADEIIEVSHRGVVVQVSGNMQLVELNTNGRSDQEIKEAVNKALKEAQKIASKKMRGQLSDLGLNLPGL